MHYADTAMIELLSVVNGHGWTLSRRWRLYEEPTIRWLFGEMHYADTAMIELLPVVNGHGWTLEDCVITRLWYEGDCLPIMVDESLLEEEICDISDVEEEVGSNVSSRNRHKNEEPGHFPSQTVFGVKLFNSMSQVMRKNSHEIALGENIFLVSQSTPPSIT